MEKIVCASVALQRQMKAYFIPSYSTYYFKNSKVYAEPEDSLWNQKQCDRLPLEENIAECLLISILFFLSFWHREGGAEGEVRSNPLLFSSRPHNFRLPSLRRCRHAARNLLPNHRFVATQPAH